MKRVAVILLLIVLSFTFLGCNAAEETYFYFGTSSVVKLEGKKTVLREIDNVFSKLDADFNETAQGSVYKINAAAADEVVEISDDAYALLEFSKILYAETAGEFNVASYALTELWRFSPETYVSYVTDYIPPTAEEIAAVLLHCNLDNLILLGGNKVKKTSAALKISFGALAKGYAGDRAVEIAKEKGAKEGIFDIGGTILTYGDREFNIGIGAPRQSKFSNFGKVTVGGGAVVCTSGDYYRYYEADGVRYHHIIGKNGAPTQNGLISVTVVGENDKINGLVADGLSTSCFALGVDGAVALAEKYDVGLIMIFNDETYKVVNLNDGVFTLFDTGYEQKA
jgi:Membrane-associated lipoprotein involved in thiamine biosynthesis